MTVRENESGKMKIAVWHNFPSGGGKRALYYHVRGLVERGHEVTCWSLDTSDQSYLPLSEFATEHVLPYEIKRSPRDGFVGRWFSSHREAIERMRAFDEACKRCAGEIEAGGFDLLFANSSVLYQMPYIMCHVRIPKALYLQEPCRYLYEASPILPWVSAVEGLEQSDSIRPRQRLADYQHVQTLRVQAKQEWLNAQACDTILVNSYFSRESLLRAYGVEARVCYLGIDTSLFRNLNLEREGFIVGLGSFDSIKRIDLAVQAVALLPEPRPPLVWISNSGNDAYRNEVRELALSLGVDLQIKTKISDGDLVDTLNRAALMLYTSRLEPFGFAALEANACGLPVVGVAEGGIRETIEDGVNGFLVDPEPAALARAAARLLQDSSLARQMGENAAAHVQRKWNVGLSIDRLETCLQNVVSAGGRKQAAPEGGTVLS
jgi:glycosyltransferase involved in cell wall biosynthesis